jgi:L-rhamnose mutarotase
MFQKYCLALDLYDDAQLIAQYEEWHKNVWPEILETISSAGIEQMEIYRISNRLFMIIEVNEQFSFEAKSQADASNPKVQEWETLLWQFQKPFPFAKPGEKWMLMSKIFSLK